MLTGFHSQASICGEPCGWYLLVNDDDTSQLSMKTSEQLAPPEPPEHSTPCWHRLNYDGCDVYQDTQDELVCLLST